MKELSEKPKKICAEAVLKKVNRVMKLLNRLNNLDAMVYEDEKGVEIFVLHDDVNLTIKHGEHIEFYIGNCGLFSEDCNDFAGHIVDKKDRDCRLRFSISELVRYSKFSPSPKIGKTDLSAEGIFELLEKCLGIIKSDLLPEDNGVIGASKFFNNKLKLSSGIDG